MKRCCHALLLVILAVPAFHAVEAQGPQRVPGDLLVMLAPGARADAIVAELQRIDGISTELAVVKELSAPMRAWLFHFEGNIAPPVMLRALREHPLVQLAQYNHIVKDRAVPDDPQYGDQWHHQSIDSEAAWDISTGGVTATGDTIVVCIIERSDLSQPDLAANAWFNHAEIPANGVDDDGNGYTDDFKGWNTPAGDDNVYGTNHGTQVAGMIGAVGNNALGLAGANWNVKMMPVAYGGVQEAEVVAAYTYPLVMRRRYNASNGAEGAFVVATNASWGIDGGQPEDSPLWCAMFDTLGAAGILNCGSTANNNVDVDVVGDMPTACSSPYMVSVTATNINDDRTFSAYGLTTIDVGAPGASVYTTNQSGGYTPVNGTSFASPLTAGVIGLLYSAPCPSLMQLVQSDPAYAAIYVRDKLFAGVEQVGNLPGTILTGGRINAGNSMQLIMNGCGPCPSPYNLSVSAVDLTTAQLSWTTVSGSVFDVRYRVLGAPDWIDVNGVAEPTWTLSGLQTCAEYEFQVRVICGVEVSDYSASFTWTSEGCCSAPAFFNSGFIGENLANLTWATLIGADSYEVHVRVAGTTGSWMLYTTANTFIEAFGLQPCTSYEAQVASVCNGVTGEWSGSIYFTTLGCGACVDNTYCPSAGTNSTSEWIERVAFDGVDHTSGNDGGYGDHTDQSGVMAINPGWVQYITLVPGYSTFAYAEWWSIWIDLDRDGVFQPAELMYQSQNGSNTTVVASFQSPWSIDVGMTRMRIVMKYGGNVADACTGYANGETEDYCVDLQLFFAVPEGALPPLITARPSLTNGPLQLVGSEPLNSKVMIMDAAGRTVHTAPFTGLQIEMDLGALPSGAYTYVVGDEVQRLAQGRFAVLH